MKDARAELVRIDSTGTAHAIGVVASQRMRFREGAYRMLPAPGHVVFMRYTGEDGRRDEGDGAVVRLAGEITAPAAMMDILALLAQTGWRGELVVMEGDHSRSIFFEQGYVVGANTTVEDERLGPVLYRYGAITEEQHAQLSARVDDGQRLGEAATELGLLSHEQLYEYISKQVEEVVMASLAVGDGTFFFLDGFDDNRLVTRHAISANALLMDGVTRMDEIRLFRERIPGDDYVPVRTTKQTQPPPDEFTNVWEAIDGHKSIEVIGRDVGIGEFETTKQIYGLLQSKHVVVHPPTLEGGPTAIVSTANSALLSVFRAASDLGKGPDLASNLNSFAVGAGVYDILFMGAGPLANGTLDADRVAQNAVIVAAGQDPENVLKQMLHEYVSFALFSAGATLGSEKEAELGREVAPILARLRPRTETVS